MAYYKTSIRWSKVLKAAKLTASDSASSGDLGLGSSIAVSGRQHRGAGAYEKSSAGYNRGAVYLFSSSGGGWSDRTETAILTASDAADSDYLGFSVAISSDGSTVAAGAPKKGEGVPVQTWRCVAQNLRGWVSGTETVKLMASDAQRRNSAIPWR